MNHPNQDDPYYSSLRMKIEQKAEYISEHNYKLYCLYTLNENYDTIVIEFEASKMIL